MECGPRFRIFSRTDLPVRLKGLFDYEIAYALVCEWNRDHAAEDMAGIEPIVGHWPVEGVHER
jgi:hypothetical protein